MKVSAEKVSLDLKKRSKGTRDGEATSTFGQLSSPLLRVLIPRSIYAYNGGGQGSLLSIKNLFVTIPGLVSIIMTVYPQRSQHNFEQVFSPEHEDFDDEANQRISHFFHGTSMGLRALSLMLSGPGSRGPYNQWQKCEEFFDVSMSWPDRDFRHEYR